MAKPIIYKKDTKYNVSYINKNGETKNGEYTPKEDLSIAKIITNIKEENSDYLKLVSIEEFKSIKKENLLKEDNKMINTTQKKFDPALDLRVKPKFKATFPEEEPYFDQIPEKLTFRKVLDALNNEENIYDVIGVNDSVVREEIFILLSDLCDIDYEEIYQLWLHGPKKDKANENFTMKKEDINEEDTFEELIPEEVESDTELEGSGEDQTQTQLDVEEAVKEVENPTEEDKLATEVANSSLDVLIADEESAIEGYNGFLTQAKNTLLPPLYEVLEKEINEIIKDEEDHINKLNTIKSAFHIEDIPLDESKEVKTEVFDIGNTIFELKLDCSNKDTFDVGELLSKNVAKELRKVADKLDATIDQGPIMDINGNKVGFYGFGYEGVMSSLDESKEIKPESVEDKNLANIKSCLNQSGIRNPHTVERMAKDVLAILNTYDEDTKDEDGLYYIPAITYAIQDKVEKITGKRPELTIESKKIKTESKDNELQNLRDKIWEYLIDDYHRLEDFTDIEMTEDTNEEIYDTAEENLAKFSMEELETILKEIESRDIDLVDWGHKVLSTNLNESKSITLDDVLNELGIMKDSPAAEEESSKIKEFMETHPEASLDQIIKAYKNYEETGLFECKK